MIIRFASPHTIPDEIANDRTIAFIESACERPMLPAVQCVGISGSCGNTWMSGNRHVSIDADVAKRMMGMLPDSGPVYVTKFRAIVERLSRTTGLNPGILVPGAVFGPLTVKLSTDYVLPFNYVDLSLVVREDVVDYLNVEQLSGWSVVPVAIEGNYEGLSLYEFRVSEINETPLTIPETSLDFSCAVCGYKRFTKGEIVGNNDCSEYPDFFRFPDPYSGGIYLSEKATRVLEKSLFAPFNNFSIRRTSTG